MHKKPAYCVYILRCSDNTLYTGIAKDLAKRMARHAKGQGSKYVRSRLPFKVVYAKAKASRGEALKHEWQIKQMRREAKQSLIKRNH